MNLQCPDCHQKYHISDYRVDDRNVYFFCDRCGHRIIVNQEKESWTRFRVFAEKEQLHLGDLPDGLTFSFNLKNIFTSYLFLLLIAAIGVSFGLVNYVAHHFISDHPVLFAVMALFVALLVNYLWDIMLYIISKNTISLIEHHDNRHFFHDKNSSETWHDLGILFIISVALPLLLVILFIPMMLMGEYGSFYAALTNPVLFSASLVVILLGLFKNVVIGFISTRSRSLGYTLNEFKRFFLVEHINIPVYMAAIWVISTLTLVVELVFIVLGFSLIIPGMTLSSAAGMISSLSLPNPDQVFSSLVSASFGGIFFMATAGIVISLFIAYFITQVQVLYTSSLYIMEQDPGKSVNRGLALIGTALLFVIFLAVVFNHLI